MKKKYYKKKRNINEIIEKRFNIISILLIFLFSIIIIRLVNIQIINKDVYTEQLNRLTVNIVEGHSAPRGRIYDRNYNLLVDNIGVRVIYYKRKRGVTRSEEIDIAYRLAESIDVDYRGLTDRILKDFWIINNLERANKKITEEERELLRKRRLTNFDIQTKRRDRITEEELSEYDEIDREAAFIYYLMNRGYAHDKKIIKNTNITDEEYAYIAENLDKYKGIGIKLDWQRKYLYGSTLRGILGVVSSSNQGVPYELKDHYLKKGYNLNDRVGISHLEFQYDELLRGKKTQYVNRYGKLMIHEEGVRGHDIVLSIDINLQLEIEKIIEEEMIKAKKEPNTQYFNRNFVVVSDPKTGEILAMASKQIIDDNKKLKIYDYTSFVPTTPIIVGSVIKGASIAVGYNEEVIDIGTRMLDECIFLASTPRKCSWRSGLGVLDDIGALKLSSNSYQFKIAMKVGGVEYKRNMPLRIDMNAFNKYRDMYAQFGLGVKTEIDLPIESTGYKGINPMPGHLLDFSIGQYDTYTPIQLSQYINTIANDGKRMKLNLLKAVHSPTNDEKIGELLYNIEPDLLNKVDIDIKYINRIQEGFKDVMVRSGLGFGYMDSIHNPAGKTGTSQSFYDSTKDGVIDKQTVTATFAGYAPYDDPKMSIVIISPDVSHIYGPNYQSQVNRRIGRKVTNKYFEIYQ